MKLIIQMKISSENTFELSVTTTQKKKAIRERGGGAGMYFPEFGPALPRRTQDRYFRELDSATLAEGVKKICQINDDIIEEHVIYNEHEEGYSSASGEEVRGWECASQRLERAALFVNEIGGKLDGFIFFGWVHFYE